MEVLLRPLEASVSFDQVVLDCLVDCWSREGVGMHMDNLKHE